MRNLNEGEKFWVKRKPRKCKSCGSNRIAVILYGFPAFSPELKAQIEAGKIVLGGCCLPDVGDPSWRCADCGAGYAREIEGYDQDPGLR